MPAYRQTATIPDLELPPEDEMPERQRSAGDTMHDDAPVDEKLANQGGHEDGADDHKETSTHHKKHAGGHEEGHGGGHGGKWLVTYCDMVTLLIAFFICILTFASKENGTKSHARLRDSLIYGTGGSGAVGDKDAKADSIVWRQVLSSVSLQNVGSSRAPLYSDPQMNANEQVLELLDQSTETTLEDNFSFRVPLTLMMNDDKTVSPAGRRLLSNIAFGLRQFPFDLIIQIDNPDVFPVAFRLSKHLTDLAGCPPSRTGISLLEGGTKQRDSVRFLFVARK